MAKTTPNADYFRKQIDRIKSDPELAMRRSYHSSNVEKLNRTCRKCTKPLK